MTEPVAEVSSEYEFKRRQSLAAIKILACQGCNAPGVYKHGTNETEIAHFKKWPGTYVEANDVREGLPVGDTCPNCGTLRNENIRLGTIWSRNT